MLRPFPVSFWALGDTDSFKMQVQSDLVGTSNDDQFTLPLKAGETYDCWINWGDGSADTHQTTSTSPTHTFSGGASTYVVSITGTFPAIYFNNGGDRLKVLKIQQWGIIIWQSIERAFWGCANMNITATDAPDLSSVGATDRLVFAGCTSLDPNIDHWDVSPLASLRNFFTGCTSFNSPLNSWDISNVTDLRDMLRGCTSFNQPMDNWDTSSVTLMISWLEGCTSFNSALDGLDFSSATEMGEVFSGCTAFNQSLANWTLNTTSAIFVGSMFKDCSALDQSFAGWDITKASYLFDMFLGTTLSATNYSATLTAWGALNLWNSRNFHGGNSTYNEDAVDSGTTDNTVADKLEESGQNFTSTVVVGDIIHNTTDDTYADVTNVDSDTVLSLGADIMVSGETYTVQHSDAAKGRYNMLSVDLWTIVDGGPV